MLTHVSLWANTHATHTFLPDSLSAFLRCYPQVSITLEEHTSPEIVMAVVRGEVEVGVVAESVEGVLSATPHEIAAAVWSRGRPVLTDREASRCRRPAPARPGRRRAGRLSLRHRRPRPARASVTGRRPLHPFSAALFVFCNPAGARRSNKGAGLSVAGGDPAGSRAASGGTPHSGLCRTR
ncbi:MAG: LysR substrate-binding domain-containing protein [Accumulibacter sp.]|uniref:LysR substrate-binding domain-containing protein n=1 Tax=Accumulibacter sp. TaxID=2053492 RepID=UPI002FC333AF